MLTTGVLNKDPVEFVTINFIFVQNVPSQVLEQSNRTFNLLEIT